MKSIFPLAFAFVLGQCHLIEAGVWPKEFDGALCTNSSYSIVSNQKGCQSLCELKTTCVGISFVSFHCRPCEDAKLEPWKSGSYGFYRRPGVTSIIQVVVTADERTEAPRSDSTNEQTDGPVVEQDAKGNPTQKGNGSTSNVPSTSITKMAVTAIVNSHITENDDERKTIETDTNLQPTITLISLTIGAIVFIFLLVVIVLLKKKSRKTSSSKRETESDEIHHSMDKPTKGENIQNPYYEGYLDTRSQANERSRKGIADLTDTKMVTSVQNVYYEF